MLGRIIAQRLPSRKGAMTFSVDEAGALDIIAWRDQVFGQGLSNLDPKMKWWKVAQACGGERGSANLVDLLQSMFLPGGVEFGFCPSSCWWALLIELRLLYRVVCLGRIACQSR